ncbi:hypothetical protein OA78_2013 [Latilactobacillus curvatus]|uniref:Uncharacterized protein n=1 Tax=Latilactobacillus curvatus TaxID=28038 RepID=A0AAJ5REZ7_LATCU|nr:hypothetical protein [Latilactobacillus curvatus]KHO12144.1 hypothetical protein OA78_2013 [Latilactobacillus curvatus]MDG2984614.1 hypothetical protein [Latilactobacillus curvatus]WDC92001.1 hypothetical protein PSR33_00225 [Latilactobacillus curvatus]
MKDFEITLPNQAQITIDVTDTTLYNYDFTSYSLAPLQAAAGMVVLDKVKHTVFSHVSEAHLLKQLMTKKDIEYIAKLSSEAKEKIRTGEWSFGVRKKTNELYAVLKDNKTGKNKSFVTLEPKLIENLGTLPELSAIQNQLAAITEQIDQLNQVVERVEQGQYNDRFAGFFSARQQVIEGLAAKDEILKRELLLAAVKISNETIAKLMFSIHQDAVDFTNLKIKSKEFKRIDQFLQNEIGYLNATVQISLIAYSALGEEQSLLAALSNYRSFINQVLLKEVGESQHTVAWKIDNVHPGNDGQFNKIATGITTQIEALINNVQGIEAEVADNGKIENV